MSRNRYRLGLAVLISSLAISGCALKPRSEASSQFAYLGTYHPNGNGLYLMSVEPNDNQLTVKKLVSALPNAAQLVVDKEGKYLYVASEVNDYNHLSHGSITSYAINKQNGELNYLNQVSSQGGSPVYLSIHPSGKFLLVANYGDGSIASYGIRENGRLTKRIQVKKSVGKAKNKTPKGAVEGSFAISGHDGPHAHMIQSSPDGKYVLSTDLGLDRIYQWKFDEGKLKPNLPAYISASSAGAGPRHFVFHPNGEKLYLVNEEASTITAYSYDTKIGSLAELQSLSTLPDDYVGTSFASGILISEDGKHIYVGNRLHNSITHFAVNGDGTLKKKETIWTRGDYPRTLSFSPDGNTVYALNQRSDNIAAFKVSPWTGSLSFTGKITAVGSPSQLVFLPQ